MCQYSKHITDSNWFIFCKNSMKWYYYFYFTKKNYLGHRDIKYIAPDHVAGRQPGSKITMLLHLIFTAIP